MTDKHIDVYCLYCGRLIMRGMAGIVQIVAGENVERLRMHLRAEHTLAIIGPDVKDVVRHFRMKVRGVDETPPAN